jgi:uncharacterized membrane protein SpoIIM required for sporulation
MKDSIAAVSKKTLKSFELGDVFREIPRTLLYFVIGSLAGSAFGFILFNINENILKELLKLWSRRLLFGAELIGRGSYTFWFIVNNLVVMLVVIVASVFILTQISRRPRFVKFKRFAKMRERPKVTLFGLYMVPIGALVINGFLIAMFASYVFLAYGYEKFADAVMLLLPHGINEVIALTLACSLGLSYLKFLKPLILKGKSKGAIETGKLLMKTKTTFYIIVIILTLVIFSGFLEGILGLFVIR